MDIVKRLKGRIRGDGEADVVAADVLRDAVDEIERLRAWYDASQDALGEILTELRKLTEEVTKMRVEAYHRE